MNRVNILDLAHNAVAERGNDYGKPNENFERIAQMWSSYTNHPFKLEDVGIMMMLVKVARLMENPHHQDSWVDIAGYSAITAEAIAETANNLLPLEDQQSTDSNLQENRY
jgi:hypothetical protein